MCKPGKRERVEKRTTCEKENKEKTSQSWEETKQLEEEIDEEFETREGQEEKKKEGLCVYVRGRSG